MAIKGLTTREDITPRFRTLGKLRKGGEKTPKGYGPDLDHFRFTSDDPGIVAAFADVYGAEPHAINVYLPYSTTEQNFPTWKEAWTAGGLQHRCDGETVTIWLGQDGKYHRTPKPCPGGCDEVGRLEVIIPELISAGYVGTVTMETHSLNDMIAITQVLLKAEELSGGDLRRVQFTLRRVPERISVPGWGDNKGKRQRVEKYLVKIEPAVDWAQAQMALTREPGAIAALPAPEDDTPEFNDAQLDADIAHAAEVVAQGATVNAAIAAVDYVKPETAAALDSAVKRAQAETQADPDPLSNYDATPFATPEAAIQWGMTSGAFTHGQHAKNAYNQLRAAAQPTDARQMAQLWRRDVARRLHAKNAQQQL